MKFKSALIALALPALLGMGCYAGPTQAEVGVAYGEPPPVPAYDYTPAGRDGYVWVDGNWYWGEDAWAWRPGYWVVGRPGFSYVQGYWGGRHFFPGHWRTGGGVVVRDHRGGYAPGRPGNYYGGARTVVPSGVRAAPPRMGRSPVVRGGSVRSGGTVVRDHR
jgi:WXXGXW repeat (2 copies)